MSIQRQPEHDAWPSGTIAFSLLGLRCRDQRPREAEEHRIVDLKGKRVVPGFYDSHVHFLDGGERLSEVALKDAADEAEFGKRLKEFAAKLPRDRWILGGNWDHDRAFKGELPTAELIDKYVPDHPVFMNRYDGHMAIVNSVALKLAGITAQTADPPGGVIFRKPGTKEPTGLLRDNAMTLASVAGLIPKTSEEQIVEYTRAAMDEAKRLGVTSIQDMDGSGCPPKQLFQPLLETLARNGLLTDARRAANGLSIKMASAG